MKVEKNVGQLDRVLRVLVGSGLLAAALLGWIDPCPWATIIGLALLLTGVFGVCITYKLLGIGTVKRGSGGAMGAEPCRLAEPTDPVPGRNS